MFNTNHKATMGWSNGVEPPPNGRAERYKALLEKISQLTFAGFDNEKTKANATVLTETSNGLFGFRQLCGLLFEEMSS